MSSRATVTIYTDADRERVARWAQQTNVGTVVEFRKKSRSTEQNSKLWAMLSEVSEQVVWYGQKLDGEDWKTIFTASLRKANVLPGIDAGTVVPLGISTSTMTIDEMGNLIELIYAFGAHQDPPVVFKDPKPESDDAPPQASGADEITSPETEDAVEPAPKATAAASSSLFKWAYADGELIHLRDFARKALDDATSDNDDAAKDAAIDRLRLNYLDVIESEDGRKAIGGMLKAVAAVLNRKKTKEHAALYIATEFLDDADIGRMA